MSTGLMIQRCHRWREKRRQYLDQARKTSDEIERERLLQMAEHYGRIVSEEQTKIDGVRGNGNGKENGTKSQEPATEEKDEDEDESFPDFLTQLNKK
ncbi:MAG: hypothetical protein FWE17_01780 [Alphaproteobacteria bacterium]|nr:hypothetical protein [Alphaproteobacteria bacterium]